MFPSGARAAEVAAFISGDRDAYKTALQGAREVVPGAAFTEFNMKGDPELGKRIVFRIREMKPAVIIAIGAQAAKLAVEQINDIPIVYCFIFNPFELDLHKENVTGVAVIASPEAQLAAFREIMPALGRLGVLYNPVKSLELIRAGREAASRLGIELVEQQISSPEEVAGALKKVIFSIDALWLVPDTTVVSQDIFSYLLWITLENKRPIFAFNDGLVKSGALIAVAPEYRETGKKAGELVNAILQGKSPRQLSLVYPGGRIFLNANTAEALKIYLPRAILNKAEKVF
ncbi:MAG: ABC transporter substrate-binding protein [bacterium]|nr:ABC transporter substrate-binding protein [bacterium]